MVLCKFFLQGNCRYGDYCKFEHQLGDNFSSVQQTNNTSILRQPYFNTAQPAKPNNPVGSTTVDTNTLVKSVVNDMNVAEKGGQWLLSTYGPCKEQPSFPGFEDQSFEEIRLGYYEARKNGNVEQYTQQIQVMLQQAMLKLKSLQSPSPDIINLLKSYYGTTQSAQPDIFANNTVNTANTFGNATNTPGQQPPNFGQQSGSIFAQTNQALFGAKPEPVFGVTQNVNIFGGQAGFGQKGMFGQPNASPTSGGSIFGGSAGGNASGTNPVVGNNIFNNATGTSVFGGQQMSSPLGQTVLQNTATPFTQVQAQPNSNSIFAKQQPIFSGQNSASPFGQQPTVFGSPSVQNAPQTFTNNTNPPMFPQQNIFAQQQNQQPASNSPFGQQIKTALDVPQNSIFGNRQLTITSNISGGQIDDTIYSKPEELTQNEIKWFESEDLDIFNIPEKPPTYQICFKT